MSFERQVRLRTPLAEEALTVGVAIRDGLGLLKRSERLEPGP
ncbi:MAG: hypothetical protein NZ733_00960 [Aigarchaeota archaeon]|nr:hypothetical protein [Aigarchaeota archaeon]MDW8044026.1 hypothetical protein [Nitrososphaerota archaeon]